MITRATDATFINSVLNDSRVRPDVADLGEGELDLSAIVANPAHIVLVGDFGGFVCFKFFEGCYEVHTQILPEGRGQWARDFARRGAEYMFTGTDCAEILTRVPEGHIGAAALTKLMGFRHQFDTPAECRFRGKLVSASIWSLTIQEWAAMPQEVLASEGRHLHELMNGALEGEPHADDPDHNKIVGISLAMFRMGRPAKATVFYNRWALSARHPQIQLLSLDPPRVKFDAGIFSLIDGSLHLEPAR